MVFQQLLVRCVWRITLAAREDLQPSFVHFSTRNDTFLNKVDGHTFEYERHTVNLTESNDFPAPTRYIINQGAFKINVHRISILIIFNIHHPPCTRTYVISLCKIETLWDKMPKFSTLPTHPLHPHLRRYPVALDINFETSPTVVSCVWRTILAAHEDLWSSFGRDTRIVHIADTRAHTTSVRKSPIHNETK